MVLLGFVVSGCNYEVFVVMVDEVEVVLLGSCIIIVVGIFGVDLCVGIVC